VTDKRGYTLLEVTVALGIWLILSAGVFFIWQYAANASTRIITRQNAFENARAAMDMIQMNLQLSDVAYLDTVTYDGHPHVLDTLRVSPVPGHLTFAFINTTHPNAERHNRVEFSGGGNEVARHIARVQIIYVLGQRMEITVVTTCNEPVVLEGSVCVRHKRVISSPAPSPP
jgi:prepilin-type N-terminal cleavage/methylation domain-containing protein